jgi:hypothetical protein
MCWGFRAHNLLGCRLLSDTTVVFPKNSLKILRQLLKPRCENHTKIIRLSLYVKGPNRKRIIAQHFSDNILIVALEKILRSVQNFFFKVFSYWVKMNTAG